MRWQQKGIIVKLNVSIMPAIQCTHKTTHTNTLTHTGAQQCPQSYSPWKHLADKKRLRKDVLLRTDNGGGVWVESEPARRKGRGACQPCHTHKNKCTIPEQQQQQQLHNGNERLKLSSWQKERKANQLEGLPWGMKARARPRLGRVCCQISAIICTYFTAIPRHRLRFSPRSLRSQFSRTFSKNAQI